jgi:hypothetical protein
MLKEVSEFARSLPFILELLINYLCIADYWHWERGSRIDDSTESDGAHISTCLMNFKQEKLTVSCIRIERCVRRDRRHSLWHIPTYEQHGCSTRLPLAMVHRLPHHCVLVFHGHLVVSKMTFIPLLSSPLLLVTYILLFYLFLPFFQYQYVLPISANAPKNPQQTDY